MEALQLDTTRGEGWYEYQAVSQSTNNPEDRSAAPSRRNRATAVEIGPPALEGIADGVDSTIV